MLFEIIVLGKIRFNYIDKIKIRYFYILAVIFIRFQQKKK